jgi:hypothetical protein
MPRTVLKQSSKSHLKPTFTLEEEADDSEVMASTAVPSLAMPPRENSAKETASNIDLFTMVPPSQDEKVGEMRATDGGWSLTAPPLNPREGVHATGIVD